MSGKFIEALESRRLLAVLPTSSGVVNVTSYGATPYTGTGTDDTSDDTAAINEAFDAIGNSSRKTLYFPDGVYKISGTLRASLKAAGDPTGPNLFNQLKRTSVEGESRTGAILRLQPGTFPAGGASGFVLDMHLGTSVAQGFHNFIRDITIEIGANNANASGIRYYSNNGGAIRNVSVMSTSGNGIYGIDTAGAENGPFLVENVQIDGLTAGFRCSDHINGVVIDGITLNDQSTTGIENAAWQGMSMRNVTVTGPAMGYKATNSASGPASVLVDATFTGSGGASSIPAINTVGSSYIRDVTTSGYANAYNMTWSGTTITGSNGSGVEASARKTGNTTPADGFDMLHATTASGLNLPNVAAPSVPWGNVSTEWIAPTNVSGDDTASIQAAINTAGKTTVYLPHSDWTINGTLVLGGSSTVVRLISLGGNVNGNGKIRIDNSTGNAPLIIERTLASLSAPFVLLENNTSRDLILRDVHFKNYSNTASGTGRVWIDGFVGSGISVLNQSGWMRQVNVENSTTDPFGFGAYILNNGGIVSILGIKTEKGGTPAFTFISTEGTGQTELLGGLHYFNQGTWDAAMPAYKVGNNASFGLAMPKRYDPNGGNSPVIFIQDTKNNQTLNRNYGEIQRSYYITRANTLVIPNAPSGLSATAISGGQIDLNWTDNSDNETGFEIERATDAGFTQNLTLVTTTAANATSYSNTGLAVATTYYYRVRATNSIGDSANSNTASATTDSTVISNVIEDGMVRSYDPDATSPSVNVRFHDRWSYLKFNLAGLNGYRVQSAILRMYESPLGVAGNTNFQIRTTTSAWSEATVTWNTKPTTSSTVFGQYTGGQLTQNQMLNVPLNPAFITGNGTYGLALLPTSGTIDSQFVAIGEAGTSPAQLLLNLVRLTPGDANGDGMVSIADLGTLASNWQRTGMTWAEGDFTGDGAVTIADLGELASNWQAGVPTGPAVSSVSAAASRREPASNATRITRQSHKRVTREVL